MKTSKTSIIAGLVLLILAISFISAVIIDAGYITLYPGEEGKVSVKVDNNENFDIENVVVSLDLSNMPFTSVGSSSKEIDSINEDDDDSVSFTLLPSTDIIPGDYNIPYKVKYVNAANDTENFTKDGKFGLRVSAKTELDFSAETRNTAIVGQEGQVSVEIINRGLGEIKSISVQIVPNGFELLSGDKVFIGTISADDSDTATFNVIYKTVNPTFQAKITYKDFDNNDQTQTVSLPIKVYTEQQALDLGLTKKSSIGKYLITIFVLLVIWFFWRRARKKRKMKEREKLIGAK